MKDLSQYRLSSSSEIASLRKEFGERFDRLQEATHKYLRQLPEDVWVDYTRKVNPANIEAMVKIICDYIDHNATVWEYVEFNDTFTMIRRKRTLKTNKVDYYETRKKKQNRCSSLS